MAVLHSDPTYLNRLTSVLGARYQNRLTLYSFALCAFLVHEIVFSRQSITRNRALRSSGGPLLAS